MKKKFNLILALILSVTLISCKDNSNIKENEDITLEETKMKSICELATMDCYFNNVAKYKEDENSIFPWAKDKVFWIEYSGIVTLGIDASLLKISIVEDKVTVSIPEAKVLDTKVNEENFNADSFIFDNNSKTISAEDQIFALSKAQKDMKATASKDTVLLSIAQQRVQVLLEDYIRNIGKISNNEYTIEWIYSTNDNNKET